MRSNLICCAVTYVVLLILLETSGAPSCDCSKDKSDEKVLSHTIEKEDSKTTAKVQKEEIEDTESESCSKNGLVSGAKSITQSRQLSEAEIEKSRLAEEKKTTKGTEKSETDVTKKKLVSVSEKKSILVYYMVSYKKLPAKKEDESRVDYYKRIFPVEDNDQVFLRKIFKCYEGEKPSEYLERVDYIFTMVYPEKDCRLDMNYQQVLDHYYTLKYSRKIDETDECYFPRVLKRWTKECNDHYKKRMALLVKCLNEEDFCHITFDDSETGYKIGVRKTPAKTRSSPSSCGDTEMTGKISSSVKKSKEEKENVDASETSIKQSDKTGTSTSDQKNLKKCKTCVETEEDTKAYAYRVAYTKLPKKTPGELDEVYYKKFFGECKTVLTEDERNEMCLRILIQYKGENCTEYVQRIDFLFDKVYPKLDVRTNKLLMGLLDHYYQEKYKKCDQETDEMWFSRVLGKLPGETVQHYNDRFECLKTTFEDVDWSKVTLDSKTGTYTLVSDKTTQSKDCTKDSKTTEDIKKTYEKKSGESDEVYYKRLLSTKCSSTTEKYSATIEKIYKTYPDLGVWGNVKFINIAKDCYTKIYGKKQCESEEQYFKRFTNRYCFETEKQFYDRMFVLHELYPNLKLWCDDKYSCYTKNMYLWWYKKTCADASDDVYFKRIFAKSNDETDDCYVKRIDMIRRCYPNLAVWCDRRYMSITKTYYTKAYTKRSGESEEVYYSRIITKENSESTECWVQRMYIIHECIPTISLWWNKNYYDKYTKTYYDNFCKKLSIDTCDKDMYTRITRQFSGESDTMYESRMTIFEENYYTLTCWSDITYLELVKHYYIIRYSKKSCESDDVWVKRIFADSKCDTSTVIRYRRINIIHRLIPTCPCWYETKYYESYTKPYYSCFYKKDDKVSCVEWLTETLKVYDGETEEMACKRIALIKKCTCNCGCWTSDNFSKVKCCKGISSSYYELIKKTYFSCSDVQYEKKSSSTSSSSSSASSCAEDSEVVIKRGVC